VLDNRFPQPGESFLVKTANDSGSVDVWNFTRPDDSDSLLDHVCFSFLSTSFLLVLPFKRYQQDNTKTKGGS